MSITGMSPEVSVLFEGEKSKSNSGSNHTPQAKPSKSMLHSALQSVERRFKISQSVKQQVEEEYIDAELMKNLSEESDNFSDEMDHFMETPDVLGYENASARLLGLKSKQGTSQSVHASILQGVDVLKSVAERASQVTSYLEKMELDIERLESVEAHSEQLRTASAKLAQEHRDQMVQNADLKQMVDELKSQISASREALETARMEVDRTADEKQRLEDNLTTQRDTIVKLEDDKLNLREQNTLWEREHGDVKAKHYEATVLIEQQAEVIREKDKKIAHQQTDLVEIDQTMELQRVELAEIRAKFDSVNSNNVGTNAKLSEVLAQLEAERRENSARNGRQQKRIAELETQNQTFNRQVAINEDLIANMKHQLNGGASKPPVGNKLAAKADVSKTAKPKKPADINKSTNGEEHSKELIH